MVIIRSVNKVFKSRGARVEALKNVSIDVQAGDIFGVIGFSGAGKSTLIRMVNALEKPTSGEVIIKGEDISQLSKKQLREVRKSIGMIFQQFNLLNSKTVYENIAIPLILKGTPKNQIRRRVEELLEFVDLTDKIDTYPDKLSGGQKQRVGIARALATNPSILLCDEATSALDPKTTNSILQLLKKINQELKVTILMITHEMNVIQEICNKVAVMEEGEIVEQGEVIDVFGSPKSEITKDFVRTVIRDRIPETILCNSKENKSNNEIIKLKFLGHKAELSVLSIINKKFNIETNILFATVNELQKTILGIVIIQITGSHREIQKTKDYMESMGVEMEEVVIG